MHYFVALKIHISPDAKTFLENLGGYHIQTRGEVFLKVKRFCFLKTPLSSNMCPMTSIKGKK